MLRIGNSRCMCINTPYHIHRHLARVLTKFKHSFMFIAYKLKHTEGFVCFSVDWSIGKTICLSLSDCLHLSPCRTHFVRLVIFSSIIPDFFGAQHFSL